MPVLVLQKRSLLDSSLLDCFIRKMATICSIPWHSTCYISKSSTWWHILLFIVSFVLPLSTQKCRFYKIDMDFEIVASTLKRNRRRSDPVLWQNPLYQQKIRKPKDNTHKRHQKLRLHNDLRFDLFFYLRIGQVERNQIPPT